VAYSGNYMDWIPELGTPCRDAVRPDELSPGERAGLLPCIYDKEKLCPLTEGQRGDRKRGAEW
jgi:hypothetical protein